MKSFLLILSLLPISSLFGQYINDISPNEADNGETLNVTITGANTSFNQATSTVIKFYFTASTTTATLPNSFTIQNNQKIVANLTVPINTLNGWYDYSVENDVDGFIYSPSSFKVNSSVGLTTYNTNSSLKVYPNPFNNTLSIEVSNDQNGSANLSLIDITGKVFESRTVNLINGKNTFELDNLNLQPGIYFVQVAYSNGKRFSTKIVKH
jgi:hypothetical protein